MHPALSDTLESLDTYIEYLQGIRQQLAQGGQAQSFSSALPKTSKRTMRQKAKRVGGRKGEVAKFLRKHGPSKRGAIIKGAGIPAGTIANVLNDDTLFVRLDRGLWDNVPA